MAIMHALYIVFLLSICMLENASASNYTSGNGCPRACLCEETKMTCKREFPPYIPDNMTEVELLEINFSIIVEGIFCKTSWDNVRKLALICLDQGMCFQKVPLGNDSFRCLHNLQSITLSSHHLTNFSTNTFSGLANVTALDLSRCSKIYTPALLNALSDESILPNLSKLILYGVGAGSALHVNQMLVDVLSKRNIQLLDLSATSVVFENPDLDELCESLTIVNVSNAVISPNSMLNQSKVCKALQTLDVSKTTFPKVETLQFVNNETNAHFKVDSGSRPLVWSVQNIYLNSLLSREYSFIFQNAFVLVLPRNNVTSFELCGYNFLNFDIEFKIVYNNLRKVALCSNNMENIGKKVFKNFTLLEEINLSNNKLSRTKSFTQTFRQLFQTNALLKEINLSNNGLTYLPFDTFKSNTLLSKLQLAGNHLEQITFDVANLKFLSLLDMRNNSIAYLDNTSRNALDRLYKYQENTYITNGSKTIRVDILGNPFSCSCASLQFILWFINSPLFTKKQEYTCKTNGEIFDMTENAVSAANEDCERHLRRIRKILLAVFVPSVAFLSIFGITVVTIKQHKKRLLLQRFTDRVKLLQDDLTGSRFLVFLSFSSKDDLFVMRHVLLPLQKFLRLTCDTSRDLVCTGDRYFRPGRTIFSEMIRCLDESAVFIAVMSKNYCNSEYCRLEIEQARLQGKAIILMFIEEVEESNMTLVIREVFRKFTRVKFVSEDGVYKLQPDWKQVCESVIQIME